PVELSVPQVVELVGRDVDTVPIHPELGVVAEAEVTAAAVVRRSVRSVVRRVDRPDVPATERVPRHAGGDQDAARTAEGGRPWVEVELEGRDEPTVLGSIVETLRVGHERSESDVGPVEARRKPEELVDGDSDGPVEGNARLSRDQGLAVRRVHLQNGVDVLEHVSVAHA